MTPALPGVGCQRFRAATTRSVKPLASRMPAIRSRIMPACGETRRSTWPDGHGHNYHREFVDGWATILHPTTWTPDRAEQLRDIISAPE